MSPPNLWAVLIVMLWVITPPGIASRTCACLHEPAMSDKLRHFLVGEPPAGAPAGPAKETRPDGFGKALSPECVTLTRLLRYARILPSDHQDVIGPTVQPEARLRFL